MDVLTHMSIIVIIAGTCVHVWAKEGTFRIFAQIGITTFNTSITFGNNIATGINARHVGNVALV